MTFSTDILEVPKSRYLYSLSSELMAEVDKALIVQLGVGVEALLNNLPFVTKLLQDFAEKVANKHSAEETTAAERILKNLVEESNPSTQGLTSTSFTEATPAKPIAPKRSSRYHTWTKAAMATFLKDCEELSPDAVMDKYGLSSRATVFSYKSKFRRDLEDETSGGSTLAPCDVE